MTGPKERERGRSLQSEFDSWGHMRCGVRTRTYVQWMDERKKERAKKRLKQGGDMDVYDG